MGRNIKKEKRTNEKKVLIPNSRLERRKECLLFLSSLFFFSFFFKTYEAKIATGNCKYNKAGIVKIDRI